MFNTTLRKKRAVGLVLLAVLLFLFLWFNRIPKLDTVQADLAAAAAPAAACFQGFCVGHAPGSTLLSRWWDFSLAYLELVSLGMVFAFLVAGLTEVFLFPSGDAQGGWARRGIRGSLRGILVGSAMNLCSACIVPVSSAFRRRGAGLETSLAIVQGSATLNLPALLMAAAVFTPMLAGSRVGLSLVGALLLGPLVARLAGQRLSPLPGPLPGDGDLEQAQMSWGEVLTQGLRDWLISSAKYLLRLGPVMVLAGFASALAIQWVSPETVGTYLGDNALGVVIAATLGLLINVPLLFEIPLVAALLLVGMGTAPAAVLLFAAAAGGPVTFWGLARVMPKKAVATFATATWGLAALGGLAILALAPLFGGGTNLLSGSTRLAVTESGQPTSSLVPGVSINRVEPDVASVLGGTMVKVFGTGLVEGSRVTFGGLETASVEFLGSDTLTVLVPPHDPGTVNVVVTLPDGNTRNLPGGFNYQQPIFSESGAMAGVDFTHYRDLVDIVPFGAGVVIFDYDNDDDQDIYVTSTQNIGNLVEEEEGNNALYRNNGDGTFTDVAVLAGVADLEGKGNGGCAADYDNDGDQDLFVANWGSSKLFQNNGDGTFTDVTGNAGLGDPDATYRSMGCAWGDYDRDGFLDFVIVRHIDESGLAEEWGRNGQGGFIDLLVAPNMDEPSSYHTYLSIYFSGVKPLALYHNEGDGTFSEVTDLLGNIDRPTYKQGRYGNVWGAGFQPTWLDFDNDGDPDLYVVNDFGAEVQPNVLWRNDGMRADGSWNFVDISADSGANVSISGMGLAVGDYNLDGFMDVFITNMGNNVLLANSRDGLSFTNTAEAARVAAGTFRHKERVSWGTVFFDYDNDGYEDLYVVSGFLDTDPHENRREQPNLLFRNNSGDGTFTDVSSISGADDLGVGRGVAYADFNGDGCLDLYQTNLGKSAYIGESANFFVNNCESGNNWIVIRTEGTVSNRSGIGARITVEAHGTTQIREVAAGSSNKSQNMLPVHFGLGSAELVDSIEILWPSGRLQTLTNVAPNQVMAVKEPS